MHVATTEQVQDAADLLGVTHGALGRTHGQGGAVVGFSGVALELFGIHRGDALAHQNRGLHAFDVVALGRQPVAILCCCFRVACVGLADSHGPAVAALDNAIRRDDRGAVGGACALAQQSRVQLRRDVVDLIERCRPATVTRLQFLWIIRVHRSVGVVRGDQVACLDDLVLNLELTAGRGGHGFDLAFWLGSRLGGWRICQLGELGAHGVGAIHAVDRQTGVFR
ncbi:hypothetical protein D3C87_1094080 [compost metagenome]